MFLILVPLYSLYTSVSAAVRAVSAAFRAVSNARVDDPLQGVYPLQLGLYPVYFSMFGLGLRFVIAIT